MDIKLIKFNINYSGVALVFWQAKEGVKKNSRECTPYTPSPQK